MWSYREHKWNWWVFVQWTCKTTTAAAWTENWKAQCRIFFFTLSATCMIFNCRYHFTANKRCVTWPWGWGSMDVLQFSVPLRCLQLFDTTRPPCVSDLSESIVSFCAIVRGQRVFRCVVCILISVSQVGLYLRVKACLHFPFLVFMCDIFGYFLPRC